MALLFTHGIEEKVEKEKICWPGFWQSLEFLKKSWHLQSNFPELEKVWNNGKKSGVYLSYMYNKCLISEFFSCGQILIQ